MRVVQQKAPLNHQDCQRRSQFRMATKLPRLGGEVLGRHLRLLDTPELQLKHLGSYQNTIA